MMKFKLISITSILVLILIIVLLFQIKIPMCYNTFEEEKLREPYVLYGKEIIEQVKENIMRSPLHYIKIKGYSMQPSIKNGDMCVCLAQENYKVDDIISFYVPVNEKVELISHRIVHEENNNFITQGDNNPSRDSFWVTEEQIFCKIPERNLFDKFRFAIVESEGKFSIFSIIG